MYKGKHTQVADDVMTTHAKRSQAIKEHAGDGLGSRVYEGKFTAVTDDVMTTHAKKAQEIKDSSGDKLGAGGELYGTSMAKADGVGAGAAPDAGGYDAKDEVPAEDAPAAEEPADDEYVAEEPADDEYVAEEPADDA